MKLRCPILLACLLACFPAAFDARASKSQEDYVVRVWDARQGLPVDAVRAIAQTPDGYLWVGTFGGLARFDGDRFQVFDVGNTPELPNNLINALFCDRRGRLWIGHDSGQVSILDGHQFQRVSLPPESLRIPIRGFGEDAEGNIWLLNAAWKLAIITPSGKVISAPETNLHSAILHLDSSAPDHRLRIITFQGQCLIASREGYTLDPDSPAAPSDGRRVIRSASGGYWALHEKHLGRWQGGRMVEDAGEVDWGKAIFATTCEWDGLIAAGTFLQGLSLAGRDGWSGRFDEQSGLPSGWVTVVFADAGGTLWVGTGDGGLAAIWPKRVRMAIPPGEAATKRIQSVTAGVDGGIWVATAGGGLFNFHEERWRRLPDIPGLRVPVYSSIWMSPKGQLWALSPGGGLSCLQDGNWRQIAGTHWVTGARRGLLMPSDRILWATTSDGVVRFSGDNFTDVKQIPASSGVSCLVADEAEGIWFGGFGTGLWHWQSGQTEVWRVQNGLPSENLLSLCRTRDGSLWISTDGGGLVRFKGGRFAVISRQQGLPSATICNMIEDADGRLWMGTYSGICAVSVEELNACAEGRLERVKCLMLDTADGMETEECSAGCQPSVCRTADGQLWFATRRGVAMVSPASIKLNLNPPPVWIEQVKTDAGTVAPGQPDQRINLPLGQRRLQIAFNAPCLRAAHRVRFKYRLEPVEPGWVDSTDDREAVYAQVAPGNYTFRVIACNEDGVWNLTGAAVVITVPPFLWERAWFAPMCWAGGAGAVAAMVLVTMRRRLKLRLERLQQQRALEQERARIARDIHDDLGASLTRITLLSDSAQSDLGDSAQTASLLGRIAVTARDLTRAMDEIVWAVNPKHDRFDSLINYIGKFAQDFLSDGNIAYRLEVPPQLPHWPIRSQMRHNLFLALKEALHNVLKHAAAKKVRIVLTVEDERFRLVVLDDGRGFATGSTPPAPDSPVLRLEGGNGLVNMKARLEEIGGQCEVRSEPGAGTSVTFTVPVKHHG